MGLQELCDKLKPINNNNSFNPDAACQAISVRVGRVLTGTAQPTKWEENDDVSTPPEDKNAVYSGGDAGTLLSYLKNTAPSDSVFRVENEDHAWNIVKDAQGNIHLIDVSCWNFKTINNQGDFIATLRNGPDDLQLPFNFGAGSYYHKEKWHQDDLNLYNWGKMNPEWSKLLP